MKSRFSLSTKTSSQKVGGTPKAKSPRKTQLVNKNEPSPGVDLDDSLKLEIEKLVQTKNSTPSTPKKQNISKKTTESATPRSSTKVVICRSPSGSSEPADSEKLKEEYNKLSQEYEKALQDRKELLAKNEELKAEFYAIARGQERFTE